MAKIINEYPIKVVEAQSVLLPLSGSILPVVHYKLDIPYISVMSTIGDMRFGGRMLYMFRIGEQITENGPNCQYLFTVPEEDYLLHVYEEFSIND
jgi:hypothetical protein